MMGSTSGDSCYRRNRGVGGGRRVLMFVTWLFCLFICVRGDCDIRSDWHGSWYHKDFPHPFNLNSTDFGVFPCVEAQGDRYVVLDRTYSCYKCVVIHERHRNVLQYKESSYCSSNREPLAQLCMEIAGDAELHSLFRRGPNVASIPCPFEGPFTFSYDRGGGNCSDPVSRVDTCTWPNRLLFRFQACHSVRSESSEEELECLASWRDGSKRYLVGKMHTRLGTAADHQDLYRCFIYEKEKNGKIFHLAQSGDASCAGVLSATEGARTMRLQKVNHSRKACVFPKWVTSHRKWHSLDGETTFHFPRQQNGTLKITGEWTSSGGGVASGHHHQHLGGGGGGLDAPAVIVSSSSSSSSSSWILDGGFTLPSSSRLNDKSDEKVTCVEEKASTSDSTLILAYSVRGCDSGYVCMRFHQRDEHVIELQTGQRASSPDYACNDELFFSESRRRTTTLVTSAPREMACPMVGRYVVESEEWRSVGRGNVNGGSHAGSSSSNYNNNNNFGFNGGGGGGMDDSNGFVDDFGGDGAGGSSRGGGGNEAGWRRRRHRGDGTGRGGTGGGAGAGMRRLVVAKNCPDSGAAPTAFSTFHVGCRDHRRLELGAKCGGNSAEIITEYKCHGSWEDNGTRFLIVSPSHEDRIYYCLASRMAPGTGFSSNNGVGPVTSASSSVAGGDGGGAPPGQGQPQQQQQQQTSALDDELLLVGSSSPPSNGPVLISYFRTSCSAALLPPTTAAAAAAAVQHRGFAQSSFDFDRRAFVSEDLVSFNVTLTGQCAQPLSSATSSNGATSTRFPGSATHQEIFLIFLGVAATSFPQLLRSIFSGR